MRERLLSGLLLLQVMVSLTLTGLLWFSPRPHGWSYRESRIATPPAPTVEPRPDPKDALRPLLLWAHLGGGRYVGWNSESMIQSLLWREAIALVAEALDARNLLQPIASSEVTAAAGHVLVGLDFAVAFSPGDWGQLWGSQRARDTSAPVDRVIIDLSEAGGIYWVGPERRFRLAGLPAERRLHLLRTLAAIEPEQHPQYRVLGPGAASAGVFTSAGSSGNLSAAVRPGSSSELWRNDALFDRLEPWLMVPTDRELPEVQTPGNGALDRRARVVRFFPDMTVVREIVESDGPVIFTDGRKALRIYPGGALEYRAPQPQGAAQPEVRQERPVTPDEMLSALQTAQRFASDTLTWPEGARIEGLDRDPSQELRLSFAWPGNFRYWVVGRAPLEVRLVADRVSYLYQSAPLEPGPGKAVATVQPGLAAGLAATVAPQGGEVRWARLGYVVRPRAERAAITLAWSIGFSRREPILVDARTGRIMP